MHGVNVDPRHSGLATPDPNELIGLGFDAVRLVSVPASQAWHDQALYVGLRTLLIVTEESQGYIMPDGTWYQLGNEPDVAEHGDSLTPDEYVARWRLYEQTYPWLTWVAGGLASGNPSWWQEVGPQLEGCSACCVHPYAKNASEAEALLQSYKVVRPDLGLWVTEGNRPVDEVVPFARMLKLECERAWWFCWADAMVPGMGLIGWDGEPNDELDRISVVI